MLRLKYNFRGTFFFSVESGPYRSLAVRCLKKAVNKIYGAYLEILAKLTVHDIPDLIAVALTQNNIQRVFRYTGKLTFIRQIFSKIDFNTSLITDKPIPEYQVASIEVNDLPDLRWTIITHRGEASPSTSS